MTDVNGDGVAGGDPWLCAPVYRREFLRRMAIIGGGGGVYWREGHC